MQIIHTGRQAAFHDEHRLACVIFIVRSISR